MSYEIKADRSQTFLLPPALDDWIPQDHPARFIAEFVESLDLQSLGFPGGHAPTGRPSFSAELLLSVICYCYFSRIRTLRGMEQACLENIGVMWLTGNEHPDHNTIALFFRKNRKAIRKLLKQSINVAASANLIGMVLHAVDGTKIQANASCKTGKYKKVLSKALTRVEESIAELEANIEVPDETGLNNFRLPKELADAKSRKAEIEKGLAEINDAGIDSLHPGEPDARIMPCDHRKVFGYNAQAVTDAKTGIIVAQDVVNNENDYGLLATMIDKVKESLGAAADTTLADTGYSAAKDLAEANQKGYNVLASLGKNVYPKDGEKPFHISRFAYDPGQDCCICPLGKKLLFNSFKNGRESDGKLKVYKCNDYKECPKRWQCSSSKRGRKIELSEYFDAIEQQRQKQKDPIAKASMARRCVIVEPTFAYAKEGLGLRRWSLRYLDGVRTQWALMCTTMNLRKLHRFWAEGVVTFG